MSHLAADRRIRSLRGPKLVVDPFAPHSSLIEDERRPDGRVERALTVFLAGAECPFTCSFCDLWRTTIEGPTQSGALTHQLRSVLESVDAPLPQRLKLYNASNFFDTRAVPAEDVDAMASLAEPFDAVTVESHANTIGKSTLAFAGKLRGRLEVAVGLETIHPVARDHLNKRLDLDRFDRAAQLLAENGIDLRVFVLLGAPYVPEDEALEWTVRTVEYAVERGAGLVSIIPVRSGNGEMERLQSLGHFMPPTLDRIEDALDRCSVFPSAAITVDVWDIERFATCGSCRTPRIDRLRCINLTGEVLPRVLCDACGAA